MAAREFINQHLLPFNLDLEDLVLPAQFAEFCLHLLKIRGEGCHR